MALPPWVSNATISNLKDAVDLKLNLTVKSDLLKFKIIYAGLLLNEVVNNFKNVASGVLNITFASVDSTGRSGDVKYSFKEVGDSKVDGELNVTSNPTSSNTDNSNNEESKNESRNKRNEKKEETNKKPSYGSFDHERKVDTHKARFYSTVLQFIKK